MHTKIYPVGTKIRNVQHGIGYILGNAHFRPNVRKLYKHHPDRLIYHMTYFPDTKIRRYLNYKQFEIIEPANDINREIALSYLPAVVNTTDILYDDKVPIGDANFYLGDIIKTDLFGQGIILSEGFYRPGQNPKSIYHHVYFPETGEFEFSKEHHQTLIKLADDKSRQKALEIIRNQILTPAFSI